LSAGESVRRPRIAVWAYNCNPELGSEHGATWAFVRTLANRSELVVFHSPADTDQLTAWANEHADTAIEFAEVHEPPSLAVIHKWFRFHRQLEFVTYGGWLKAAIDRTREEHRTRPFDAIAHVSYSNYWLPSPSWKLGLPSIWGPAGGGVRTPFRLLPTLGPAGILAEVERTLGLTVTAMLPATRRTHRRVTVPIVETLETRSRLVRSRRDEALIVNRVALIDPLTAGEGLVDEADHRDPNEFLFTSALWAKKGTKLAVEALAYTDPPLRLSFVNDGYDQSRLQRLAKKRGVADRISFDGRIPRAELFSRMRGAAGLVFTGLREEGGLALAEAMHQGLPVVVLGHGGAGLVARQALDPARVRVVPPGSPRDTARRLGRAMTELHAAAPEARTPTLDPRPHVDATEVALARAVPHTRRVSSQHAPSRGPLR
jgi:glycosyltransferase involved in cell wall biosynthesis